MKPYKLAILTSHPIEYQGPLFKYIAQNFADKIELMVYFCWDFGIKETYEPDFNTKVKWDFPILEGYKSKLLKNFSLKPGSSYFFGEINPSIVWEIVKGKYNAILIHGWNSLTIWFAFFAAFISKTPIFLHGESTIRLEVKKPEWKIVLRKIVFRWLFHQIKAFMYIGRQNKTFYELYGVPEDKLFFMPYAVDNDKFTAEAKELASQKYFLRKKLRIDEDKVVILFTGKLIEKKSPLSLLKAYSLIENRNKALIFMGDGPLREKIEKIISLGNYENIYITGFIGQNEIKDYYIAADIFVLPSDERETWGMAVNEAMCFRLPIVLSTLVGCGSDLVQEGKNGYRVERLEELTDRLTELILDKEKREEFGKKSFNLIQNYSYNADIASLLRALKNEK